MCFNEDVYVGLQNQRVARLSRDPLIQVPHFVGKEAGWY